MLTVTALARKCGLSRSTLLYYEREGLLSATCRAENGYRHYGKEALARLKSIAAYRSYGLPIEQIKSLLDDMPSSKQAVVLKAQFHKLEAEIEGLKAQQRAIMVTLQDPTLIAKNSMNKNQWVAVMRAAGMDNDAMRQWHVTFEKMQPEKHQAFLESLGINAAEIKRIRGVN